MKRNSLFFYRLGDCVSVQAQRALASTNHSMPVQMKAGFFEGENMCWNVVNMYAGRALKAEFNKQALS